MKRFSAVCRVLAGLVLFGAAHGPPPAPQDSVPRATEILAGMNWLEGAWRGTSGRNVFEACYTSPEGGEILSCSKEIADGRAVGARPSRTRSTTSPSTWSTTARPTSAW